MPKTESAISRILRVTPKTESAVSRVTKIVPKTETAVSRITKAVSKTETAVSRITKVTPRTETAISCIFKTTSQTETAVSRITRVMPKTETAVSRITRVMPKTETAVSRITAYISPCPITLYAHATSAQSGDANPTGFTCSTPMFSFINKSGTIINVAQIQVTLATDTGFASPIWDSGDIVRLTNCANDARCADIAYNHPSAANFATTILENSGSYIWKARTKGSIYSEWSAATSITMQASGNLTARFYAIKETDAELRILNQATWAAARNATSADYFNIDCTETTVSTEKDSSGYFGVRRPPFGFATALLPDTATIISGAFKIYNTGTLNGDNDGYDYINIFKCTLASHTGITYADFSTAENNKGSTDLDISSISGSGAISFVLNATGLSWINKTGYTDLMLREGHDIDDHAYAGANDTNNLVFIAMSDYVSALATKAPYLEVFYNPEASTVSSKTETAVSRITKAVPKTETAVACIFKVTTKTESAASRITRVMPKTETAVACIFNTTLRTESAVSRILRVTPKTETAVSCIAKTTSQAESAISRILQVVLKTESAVSRIARVMPKTETAVSRITRSVLKTETAISRISLTTPRTEMGKALVTAQTNQNEQGKSAIKNTTNRPLAGKAAIEKTTNQTSIGKATIKKTVERTLLGKSTIEKLVNQTLSGVADVKKSAAQVSTGKAAIKRSVNQTSTGASRISATNNKALTAVSCIKKTSIKSLSAVSAIDGNVSKTETGISRITKSNNKTLQGTSRIFPFAELIDSYDQSNQSSTWTMYGGGLTTRLGQSFVPGKNFLPTSCDFYMRKEGTIVGDAYAKIYLVSAGLPIGSAVAVSNSIDVSILTASFSVIPFTFNPSNQINSGGNYAVFIEYTGAGNASNKLLIGYDNTLPTHSGNIIYYVSSWSADTAEDLCFHLYGTEVVTTTKTLTGVSAIRKSSIKTSTGISRLRPSWVAFEIDEVTYDGAAAAVNLGSQDTVPRGIVLSTAGTKLFMVGYTGKKIYQYSIGTAWNLTTCLYNSEYFDVSAQTTNPMAVCFSETGTKMFLSSYSDKKVYQYTVTTAWDVRTAYYDNVSLDMSVINSNPQCIRFNSNGTSFYAASYDQGRIYQYNLSYPYDLATASYDDALSTFGQDQYAFSFFFKSDGSKLYVIGDSYNRVSQYSLGSPYDISTASYDNRNFWISQDNNPNSLFFKDDGRRMYVFGSANKILYSYSTVSTKKTLTGKARITTSVSQTETGKALIKRTEDKTVLATSRITRVMPRTLSAVACIATLRTETGRARIEKTANRTVSGIADIKKTINRDLSGRSQIIKTYGKNLTATSRVLRVEVKTLSGKANINATTTRTASGVARIGFLSYVYETGVARISRIGTQTESAVATIQKSQSRTLSGISTVQKSVSRTLSGKAAILISQNKTLSGLSRIKKTINQTETGKASLIFTRLKTVTAVARIAAKTFQSITATSSITHTGNPLPGRINPYRINMQKGKFRGEKDVSVGLCGKISRSGASGQKDRFFGFKGNSSSGSFRGES